MKVKRKISREISDIYECTSTTNEKFYQQKDPCKFQNKMTFSKETLASASDYCLLYMLNSHYPTCQPVPSNGNLSLGH